MGKFKRGHSGNPSGRKKADPAFRQALKDLNPEAVETIAKHMRDKRAKHVSLKAAIWVVEQNEGRATQKVKLSGDVNMKGNPYAKLSTRELLEEAKNMGLELPKEPTS
jgi:hypothetical protein